MDATRRGAASPRLVAKEGRVRMDPAKVRQLFKRLDSHKLLTMAGIAIGLAKSRARGR